MNLHPLPFVSVIVPVYKGMTTLPACLDALEQQIYAVDRYEVLLIDNGENPAIEACIANYPHVNLLIESQPSSYIARNTGLAHAHGEGIAFTDADCIPDPNWLQAGMEA